MGLLERQTSFAGGEFAPTLWGRTDFQRYATGAEKILNFFVGPYGELHNRAGGITIGRTKDDGEAVLAPFVFDEAAGDVVLLVFTDQALRFYKQPASGIGSGEGWQILTSGGAPVELVTAYAGSTLTKLRFAQLGNVITITHEDYDVYELKRTSEDSTAWDLTALGFEVPDFLIGAGVVLDDVLVDNPDADNYDEPNSTFRDSNLFDFNPVLGLSDALVVDPSHPGNRWQWAVTRIIREPSGREFQTAKYILERYFDGDDSETGINQTGSFLDIPTSTSIAPGRGIMVYTRAIGGTATDDGSGNTIVSTRVYRGVDGRFGLLGETTSSEFNDDGSTPDYENPPPAGTSPFDIYENGVVIRSEKPRTCAFHQSRRYFGGSRERPNFIVGSAVDDYRTYDEVEPPDSADALSFEIASKRFEAVRALISGRALIALTSSSVWEITGAGTPLIEPLSISATPVSEHGCGELEPLVVESSILFVQQKSTFPWALLFSTEGGGYQGVNLGRFSRHFFIGHRIVSWTFTRDPYPVVWAVRDDGVLLSMAYSREDELAAWTQHEIAGDGVVESVTALPEGTEDGVYLVVNRDGLRTIERLAPRVITDVREAVFLDGAVYTALSNRRPEFNGIHNENLTVVITDTSGDEGAVGSEIKVVFYDLGSTTLLYLPEVGEVLQVEDPDGGPPGRFQVVENIGPHLGFVCVVVAELSAAMFDTPAAPTDPDSLQWYGTFDTINGLDHLEGREAYAFVDGNVVGPLTVQAGAVALPGFFAMGCAGLRITAQVQGLEFPEERGKKKITSRAWVEIEGSRGGYVGARLDGDLQPLPARDVSQGFGTMPLLRDTYEVPVVDEWGQKGAVALQHVDPTPLSLLGIMREVTVGG